MLYRVRWLKSWTQFPSVCGEKWPPRGYRASKSRVGTQSISHSPAAIKCSNSSSFDIEICAGTAVFTLSKIKAAISSLWNSTVSAFRNLRLEASLCQNVAWESVNRFKVLHCEREKIGWTTATSFPSIGRFILLFLGVVE